MTLFLMTCIFRFARRPERGSCCALILAACATAALTPVRAGAQLKPPAGKPTVLPEVVVSATRVEEDSFDLPVSIDRVDRSVIREDKPQVNLSESLNRVPGVVVQNRQNYAQDLQISIARLRRALDFRRARIAADRGRHPRHHARRPGTGRHFQPGLGRPHRGDARAFLQPLRQRRRRRHPDLHRGRPARADAVWAAFTPAATTPTSWAYSSAAPAGVSTTSGTFHASRPTAIATTARRGATT